MPILRQNLSLNMVIRTVTSSNNCHLLPHFFFIYIGTKGTKEPNIKTNFDLLVCRLETRKDSGLTRSCFQSINAKPFEQE